jgi:hypothetical protein
MGVEKTCSWQQRAFRECNSMLSSILTKRDVKQHKNIDHLKPVIKSAKFREAFDRALYLQAHFQTLTEISSVTPWLISCSGLTLKV